VPPQSRRILTAERILLMRLALRRLPLSARLRDLAPTIIDHLWYALAVVLGLILASWLCAALGLPSPLAPVENLLVL
jgi:hypothetical protein